LKISRRGEYWDSSAMVWVKGTYKERKEERIKPKNKNKIHEKSVKETRNKKQETRNKKQKTKESNRGEEINT
jgi:hypothetical protein